MKHSYHFAWRFIFLFVILSFVSCSNDDETNGTSSSIADIVEAMLVLQQAESDVFDLNTIDGVMPKLALAQVAEQLQNEDERVRNTLIEEEVYLHITTTNDITTTLILNEVDENDISIYRGGGKQTVNPTNLHLTMGQSCDSTIQNKKVLLYGAAASEFFGGNGYQQDIANKILNANIDVELTVLKDEEATIDVLEQLNQYGLVFLDTHGTRNSFLIGDKVNLDQPLNIKKEEAIPVFEAAFLEQFGEKNLGYLKEGYFKMVKRLNMRTQSFFAKVTDFSMYLNEKGIAQIIPSLENTILVGNMCYSGYNIESGPKNVQGLRTSFEAKIPLSYYCYIASENSDISYRVPNSFAITNELNLIERLLNDSDCTGEAHLLKPNNQISIRDYNEELYTTDYGALQFMHFRNMDYHYMAECVKEYPLLPILVKSYEAGFMHQGHPAYGTSTYLSIPYKANAESYASKWLEHESDFLPDSNPITEHTWTNDEFNETHITYHPNLQAYHVLGITYYYNLNQYSTDEMEANFASAMGNGEATICY